MWTGSSEARNPFIPMQRLELSCGQAALQGAIFLFPCSDSISHGDKHYSSVQPFCSQAETRPLMWTAMGMPIALATPGHNSACEGLKSSHLSGVFLMKGLSIRKTEIFPLTQSRLGRCLMKPGMRLSIVENTAS